MIQERRAYEHLLLPGVFVTKPEFLIVLLEDGQELGTFGAYLLSENELEDGIMFRLCSLMQQEPNDEGLTQCQAEVIWSDGRCDFTYDAEKELFRRDRSRRGSDHGEDESGDQTG